MSNREREREGYWREVVGRQASSGLSVAAFCRQESISAPSLYAWRRKLGAREAIVESTETATTRQAAASQSAHFIPVRIERSQPVSCVRIVLPQGAYVEAPCGIEPAVLADVLHSLREAPSC